MIANENGFLIRLSESDRTDFGRVEFSKQSDPQKVPLPADRDAREAALDSLDKAEVAKLEALGRAFLGYPDNLTDLLYEFVMMHGETFGAAR